MTYRDKLIENEEGIIRYPPFSYIQIDEENKIMSRIEQLIGEIEEYIDSCKFQPLSNTKIVVNKEELEELLVELRLRIPDEIKKYQKIISNEDAILNEARSQADAMLAEANAQTNEMVNEHEIMQRAYAQAQQIIDDAQQQAQQIVDSAVADADSIRQSSINYTDDMLKSLQTIISHSLEEAGGYFNAMQNSLQSSYDIVTNNRNELASSVTEPTE
jgi:vacuolar-type H+-ATPase subunit E/Vma4